MAYTVLSQQRPGRTWRAWLIVLAFFAAGLAAALRYSDQRNALPENPIQSFSEVDLGPVLIPMPGPSFAMPAATYDRHTEPLVFDTSFLLASIPDKQIRLIAQVSRSPPAHSFTRLRLHVGRMAGSGPWAIARKRVLATPAGPALLAEIVSKRQPNTACLLLPLPDGRDLTLQLVADLPPPDLAELLALIGGQIRLNKPQGHKALAHYIEASGTTIRLAVPATWHCAPEHVPAQQAASAAVALLPLNFIHHADLSPTATDLPPRLTFHVTWLQAQTTPEDLLIRHAAGVLVDPALEPWTTSRVDIDQTRTLTRLIRTGDLLPDAYACWLLHPSWPPASPATAEAPVLLISTWIGEGGPGPVQPIVERVARQIVLPTTRPAANDRTADFRQALAYIQPDLLLPEPPGTARFEAFRLPDLRPAGGLESTTRVIDNGADLPSLRLQERLNLPATRYTHETDSITSPSGLFYEKLSVHQEQVFQIELRIRRSAPGKPADIEQNWNLLGLRPNLLNDQRTAHFPDAILPQAATHVAMAWLALHGRPGDRIRYAEPALATARVDYVELTCRIVEPHTGWVVLLRTADAHTEPTVHICAPDGTLLLTDKPATGLRLLRNFSRSEPPLEPDTGMAPREPAAPIRP